MQSLSSYLNESLVNESVISFKGLDSKKIEEIGEEYYSKNKSIKKYPKEFFIYSLLKIDTSKFKNGNFEFDIDDFYLKRKSGCLWLQNRGYDIFFNIPLDEAEGKTIKDFEEEYGEDFARWRVIW